MDEIDSGLDVDAFRAVAKLLSSYNSSENTLIIITHYFEILEYVPIDHVILLEAGRVTMEGDMSIVDKVKKHGFGS